MQPPEDMLLPADNRKGPNCGITAVAVVSGASFERVWQIVGARKPPTWRGSVYDHDVARALKHLKVRYRTKTYPTKPKVSHFAAMIAKPGVRYLLMTGHHVLVVKDGLAVDQNGYRPASEINLRVGTAFEVRDV